MKPITHSTPTKEDVEQKSVPKLNENAYKQLLENLKSKKLIQVINEIKKPNRLETRISLLEDIADLGIPDSDRNVVINAVIDASKKYKDPAALLGTYMLRDSESYKKISQNLKQHGYSLETQKNAIAPHVIGEKEDALHQKTKEGDHSSVEILHLLGMDLNKKIRIKPFKKALSCADIASLQGDDKLLKWILNAGGTFSNPKLEKLREDGKLLNIPIKPPQQNNTGDSEIETLQKIVAKLPEGNPSKTQLLTLLTATQAVLTAYATIETTLGRTTEFPIEELAKENKIKEEARQKLIKDVVTETAYLRDEPATETPTPQILGLYGQAIAVENTGYASESHPLRKALTLAHQRRIGDFTQLQTLQTEVSHAFGIETALALLTGRIVRGAKILDLKKTLLKYNIKTPRNLEESQITPIEQKTPVIETQPILLVKEPVEPTIPELEITPENPVTPKLEEKNTPLVTIPTETILTEVETLPNLLEKEVSLPNVSSIEEDTFETCLTENLLGIAHRIQTEYNLQKTPEWILLETPPELTETSEKYRMLQIAATIIAGCNGIPITNWGTSPEIPEIKSLVSTLQNATKNQPLALKPNPNLLEEIKKITGANKERKELAKNAKAWLTRQQNTTFSRSSSTVMVAWINKGGILYESVELLGKSKSEETETKIKSILEILTNPLVFQNVYQETYTAHNLVTGRIKAPLHNIITSTFCRTEEIAKMLELWLNLPERELTFLEKETEEFCKNIEELAAPALKTCKHHPHGKTMANAIQTLLANVTGTLQPQRMPRELEYLLLENPQNSMSKRLPIAEAIETHRLENKFAEATALLEFLPEELQKEHQEKIKENQKRWETQTNQRPTYKINNEQQISLFTQHQSNLLFQHKESKIFVVTGLPASGIHNLEKELLQNIPKHWEKPQVLKNLNTKPEGKNPILLMYHQPNNPVLQELEKCRTYLNGLNPENPVCLLYNISAKETLENIQELEHVIGIKPWHESTVLKWLNMKQPIDPTFLPNLLEKTGFWAKFIQDPKSQLERNKQDLGLDYHPKLVEALQTVDTLPDASQEEIYKNFPEYKHLIRWAEIVGLIEPIPSLFKGWYTNPLLKKLLKS
jgi:hypothetical protein